MRARRDLLRLKYWARILQMGEERLVRQVYEQGRRAVQQGTAKANTWCVYTRELLGELGLEEHWETNETPGLEEWDLVLREKIEEREQRAWREGVERKPKLELYGRIKTELKMERYLEIEDVRGRSWMTALRGGTHPLRVETGRYRATSRRRRLERWERRCLICGNGEVEDELHFLLRCGEHEEARDRMMERVVEELGTERAEMERDEDRLVRVLLGDQGTEGTYAAVAEFCAERMAWRNRYVKRHLDLGR